MEEILEQVKKLSREERLKLIEQICELETEDTVEDESFQDELERRAQHAIQNPRSGISWSEVKARLLSQNHTPQEVR